MCCVASQEGFTALMDASQYGHVEIVNILLAADANVNAASNVSSIY